MPAATAIPRPYNSSPLTPSSPGNSSPRPTEPWAKVPKSLIFNLDPHLLATWLRVKSFDWNGKGCTAALETLAAGTASERQLRRNLRELQRRGLLKVVERPGQTAILWALDPLTPATGGADIDDQGGGRQRPPNKIQKLDQEKKQQPTPAAPVVVPSDALQKEETSLLESVDTNMDAPETAPDTPKGDLLALNVPSDLAALPSRVRGLSVATVRRLVASYGTVAVRRAIATIEESYPDKGAIRVFGALLQRTLVEGWTSTQQEEQAKREALDTAIAAARPPKGTKWAEKDGQVLQVIEVTENAVRTSTGIIPRICWPEWTFRTDEAQQDAYPETSRQDLIATSGNREQADREKLGVAEKEETIRRMLSMPATRRMGTKLAAEWGIAVERI